MREFWEGRFQDRAGALYIFDVCRGQFTRPFRRARYYCSSTQPGSATFRPGFLWEGRGARGAIEVVQRYETAA